MTQRTLTLLLFSYLLPFVLFAQSRPCPPPIYYQESDPCFLELAQQKQRILLSPEGKKKGILAPFDTDAPEQNCSGALPVCKATYVQNKPYQGAGSIEDILPDSTCLKQGERNSVWYTFTVQSGGTFGFELVVDHDYDFALYDITNISCDKIPTSQPVRCNYSSAQGPRTGLDPNRTFAGNISVDHMGPPMMPGLQVRAGQTYALLVSKFTTDSVGYKLNFTGTASIIDDTPPGLAVPNPFEATLTCDRSFYRIKIRFNEPIACHSVAPEDFQVTRQGPGGMPVRIRDIICGPDAFSSEFTLEIPVSPPYTVGYLLRLVGAIEDKCGNRLTGPNTPIPLSVTPPLSVSITSNFVLCNGGTTRTVRFTPSGGAPRYEYQLDGGEFTINPFFTNLSPGLRKFTIRDGQGCALDTAIFVPPIRPPVAVRELLVQNPNCQEPNSGKIEVEITGGFLPYRLQWSNGSGATKLEGLAAGNYTLNVTDSAGCAAVYRAALSNPDLPRLVIEEVTPLSCFGDSNAVLQATVTGGIKPYTYNWSNGSTEPVNSNLKAGVYALEIKDAANCLAQSSYQIKQPDKLEVTLVSLSDETCRNAKDGQIRLSVSGGAPPLLLRWSPRLPPRPNQSNLAPGEYTLEVIDANRCASKAGPFTIAPGLDSCVSGVINRYYKITGFDRCENTVTVTSTNGLRAGEQVLLIQMQGALVDGSDSPTSGALLDLGVAGNYERATIAEITNGTTITFKEKLLNRYEPNFQAQLITIPRYSTIVIRDTLTAPAWNGNTGGVLIFDAEKVKLEAAISVMGKGFRGGRRAFNRPVNASCNQTNFLYDYSTGKAGEKGESIAVFGVGQFAGKGPWANGGGGGNEHNAGGGGGGHTGNGGDGGFETASCPQNPNYGKGGYNINLPANRIFMGGGGGGGHQNDNQGSAGAGGGGIIIIRAQVIEGNNQILDASGADVSALAGQDGAGGGGAGGTIALEVEKIEGSIIARASGGKGGDIRAINCHGPGGGGSGGAVRIKSAALPPALPVQLNGGAAGVNLLCTNPAYTGQPGEVGELYFNYATPQSTTDFTPKQVTIAAQGPVSFCKGKSVTLNASSGFLQYEWIRNGAELAGIAPEIEANLPGNYQVKATDEQGCEYLSNQITLFQLDPPSIEAQIITPRCAGQSTGRIELNISQGLPPYTYQWSNATTFSVLHNVPAGLYQVRVTDARGCAAEQTFTITEPAPIIIQDIAISAPSTALTSDGSISVRAEGGTPPYQYVIDGRPPQTQNVLSNLPEGNYTLRIIDANGCVNVRNVALQAPCLAPSSLFVSAIQLNSALLRWAPYPNIEAYEISYRPVGAAQWTVLSLNAPADSLRINALRPETQYEVEIKSLCATGISEAAATAQFTTLSLCLPPIIGAQSVCKNSTLSILGSFSQTDGQLNWYSSSGTLLLIGNPLVTTPLQNDTVFIATIKRHGCESDPVRVPVKVLPLPEVSATLKGISCETEQNGSISLSVRQGRPPYTYLWSHGPATPSLTGLKPGSYSVTVSDANGCSSVVGPLRIDSTDAYYNSGDYIVGANVEPSVRHCFEFSTPGTPSQNTATYQEALPLNQPFIFELNLQAQKGSNVNKQYLDWELRAQPLLTASAFKLRLETQTQRCDSLILEWNGSRLQAAALPLCDASSNLLSIRLHWDPVARLWQVFQGNTLLLARNINLSALLGANQGYWSIAATQQPNGGRQQVCVQNIQFPCPCASPLPSVRIQASGRLSLCPGDSLSLTAPLGFTRYFWSSLNNQPSITVKEPGRYAVIVENAQGCRAASDTLTIRLATPPTVTLTAIHPTCSGFTNGSIEASIQGGAPPYQALWSNGSAGLRIFNLGQGPYTLTVTDALGCKATAAQTLTPPIALILTATETHPSSPFINDGAIAAQVSGGTPPYTFLLNSLSQNSPLFTGLAAGRYLLTARDSKGCEVSVPVTLQAPCIPPSLELGEITATTATLSWNALPNATGYKIRYREQGSVSFQELTLPGASLSTVLRFLSPSSVYEVQISAFCEETESSFNQTTFSTLRQCLSPAAVQVTRLGYAFAELNWDAVSFALQYIIRYRVKESPNWRQLIVTAPPARLENLLPDTPYEFTLQTDCGQELFSPRTVIAVFQTLSPCPVPTRFTVSAQEEFLALRWDNMPGAVGYRLRWREIGASTWQLQTLTASPYLFNADPGSVYEFELYTLCAQDSSLPVSQTGSIPKTCSVPQNLRAEEVSATSARIFWSPSLNAQSYELAYRKVNTPLWSRVSVVTEEAVLTGLIPGATYEMTVRAICGPALYSAYSTVRQFTALWECIAPTSIQVTLDSTSATLNWEPLTGLASAYQITVHEWGRAEGRKIIVAAPPLQIDGLKPQTRYQYEVRSICAGDTSLGVVSDFTTRLTCLPPTQAQAIWVTPTAAQIEWQPGAGATQYYLAYRPINVAEWSLVFPVSSSVTLEPLTPGTTYELMLRSDCGHQTYSSFTSLLQFQTPGVCEEVVVGEEKISQNEAFISWNFPPNAIAYRFRWRLLGQAEWNNQVLNRSSVSLQGLLPGQIYEYEIQTLCKDNASGWLYRLFTTLPLCPPVTRVALSSLSATEAVLDWEETANAQNYYFVYRKVNTPAWELLLPEAPPLRLSSLAPNTTYEWMLRAECAPGLYSTFNVAEQFTTAPDCRSIEELQATALVEGFRLNWPAVAGAENYSITFRKVGENQWNAPQIVSTNAYILLGLEPFTAYEVRAVTNCGLRGLSSAASIVITTQGECAAPQALNHLEVTDTSAFVRWQAVRGASRYELFYRRLNSVSWKRVSISSTEAILAPLTPLTTYEYMVRAACEERLSSYSPLRWLTTKAMQARSGQEEAARLSFYPNPTKGELYIAELPPIAIITVTDLAGRILTRTERFSENSDIFVLDLSFYTAGWYLITVEAEGRKQTIKVFRE
jgi:hypothetical protein